MKTLIITAAVLFAAIPLRAQITLEHIYPNFTRDFGLVKVDSNEWKFISTFNDTIEIHNMDHSLDRIIAMPWVPPFPNGHSRLLVIARQLFTTDTSYAYLALCPDKSGEFSSLRVFKEDGSQLFIRDSSYLGTNNSPVGPGLNSYFPSAIKATPNGTKMIIATQINGTNVEVYSLPGRLPGSSQMLTVSGDPSNPNYTLASPAAYPNPSQGRIRIAYDLPAGMTSGEIVLTTSDGREVKRYHITNAFSDLLIEEGDLPAGSYFYKVVTARGESPVQKIIHE